MITLEGENLLGSETVRGGRVKLIQQLFNSRWPSFHSKHRGRIEASIKKTVSIFPSFLAVEIWLLLHFFVRE